MTEKECMEGEVEVYKVVVRYSGNRLLSAIISNNISIEDDDLHKSRYEKYCIEYKVNEWVYPNVGKLFCFRTLENAISFYNDFKNVYGTDYEIWRGVAVGLIGGKVLAISINCFDDFWHRYIMEDGMSKILASSYSVCFTPLGTLLADGIKILERVK